MRYSSFPVSCYLISIDRVWNDIPRPSGKMARLTFFRNLAPRPLQSPISRSFSNADFSFPVSRTSSKRYVNSSTSFCIVSCSSQNLNGTTSSSKAAADIPCAISAQRIADSLLRKHRDCVGAVECQECEACLICTNFNLKTFSLFLPSRTVCKSAAHVATTGLFGQASLNPNESTRCDHDEVPSPATGIFHNVSIVHKLLVIFSMVQKMLELSCGVWWWTPRACSASCLARPMPPLA